MPRRILQSGVFTALLTVTPSFAQPCETEWSAEFGVRNWSGGAIYALIEFDPDGTGPESPGLYAGGSFTQIDGRPTKRLAKWDGEDWAQVGEGINNGTVLSFAIFDEDDNGPNPPRLFIGGTFSGGFLRWDGFGFSSVGSVSGAIGDMIVWDPDGDGSEPESLFIYGVPRLSGTPYNGVLRWNGTNWIGMPFSPLWGNLSYAGCAFAVFDDDGDGPLPERLYVGGGFSAVSQEERGYIARWTGGPSWELVGGGLRGASSERFVRALCVYDPDDQGPQSASLIAAGSFDFAGDVAASNIARWDGSSWTAMGSEAIAPVYALDKFDADGTGGEPEQLIAGGNFHFLRRWDGAAWLPLASFSGFVEDFLVISRNSISTLLVCGGFSSIGGVGSTNVAALLGCTTACPGDIDGDAEVDLGDLTILLAHFGLAEGASPNDGDFNGDQAVSIEDLTILLSEFGTRCD